MTLTGPHLGPNKTPRLFRGSCRRGDFPRLLADFRHAWGRGRRISDMRISPDTTVGVSERHSSLNINDCSKRLFLQRAIRRLGHFETVVGVEGGPSLWDQVSGTAQTESARALRFSGMVLSAVGSTGPVLTTSFKRCSHATLPVSHAVGSISLSPEFCSRSQDSSTFAAGQVKRHVKPEGA
jgi:hypothetical protein